MKEVALTQGLVAMVDDCDFDRVNAFKWCATKNGKMTYAVRKVKTDDGRTTSQLLHRFILGVIYPEIYVDHKDHNGLNCQRNNLRKCVYGENAGNRLKTHGSSKYKGVSWDSSREMWRSSITVRGKSKTLGRFYDELDAALVYDAAARDYFGDFALCNFPRP